MKLTTRFAIVVVLLLPSWAISQTTATSPADPLPPEKALSTLPAEPLSIKNVSSPPAATQPATSPLSATMPIAEATSLPTVGENVQAVRIYAAGDYQTAADMLEKAYRAGRTGIQDRLILARAYLHMGKTDDAMTVLKNVLDSDKENPDANSLIGQILLNAGKNEQALEFLEHAFRLKNDAVAAGALGRCHYALGNAAKAKTYLTAALQQDIRDPSNSFLLGRIHLDRGSGAMAEKYLLMAQEAGMESPDLHLRLGQAYMLEEKPLGPVMVKRLAGSPQPGDLADGCVVLGKVAGSADQYKVCTRYCGLYEGYQLLKGDKQNPDGLYMVASGWFAAGNNDLATANLKSLTAKEPQTRRACELQARLLVAAKDFNALEKALATGKAGDVFDSRTVADFLCRAAAVLRAEGKRDAAIALLKKAEQEQPTSQTVLRPLAILYVDAGDDKQAIRYYARIVELFPDADDIDELRNALKVLQEKTGVQQ